MGWLAVKPALRFSSPPARRFTMRTREAAKKRRPARWVSVCLRSRWRA